MPDPRAEALLYLRWLRGAGGRWLYAEAPPPAAEKAAGPTTSTAPLERLRAQVEVCTRCALSETRNTTVFGEGSAQARLVIVGEAPGAEEDRTGRPFVGRAGELLTRMLAAIGLARQDVFICNVLKCRPPQNRDPQGDEVAACRPFLEAQIETLAPDLLLALGSHAARLLLRTERGITSLRGRVHVSAEGWRVLPTFHPAYLLRNPAAKREAWLDLQRVAAELGLSLPKRS
jgi:DNA polymerase